MDSNLSPRRFSYRHARSLWLLVVFTLCVPCVVLAQGNVLVTDPTGDIRQFELYQNGAYWWEGDGDCTGEDFNYGTVRVKPTLWWGSSRYLVSDCHAHTGEYSGVARDGTFVYYWHDGELVKKSVMAGESSPFIPLRIPAVLLPAGQGSSPLHYHDGYLYYAAYFGASGQYALRRVAADGSTAPLNVHQSPGPEIQKIEVVDYPDSTWGDLTALIFLESTGRLVVRRLGGDNATLYLSDDVLDFAVHTLGRLQAPPPFGGPAVTSVYAAIGKRTVFPSSPPGRLDKIEIENGLKVTLHTATGNRQIVAVGTDSYQPRSLFTGTARRNVYIAEAVYVCDLLCGVTHHRILRARLNYGLPPPEWTPIVLQGQAYNLRSDDQNLYYASYETGGSTIKLFWIATDAPPAQLDLEALGVEIVQNTQNLDGEMLLVAGKKTFVRAYARIATDTAGFSSVSPSADLEVVLNNNPIAGSPFRSTDNPRITASTDLASARSSLDESWLWEIPTEFVQEGTLGVLVHIDPDQTTPETESTANNHRGTGVIVSTKGKPCLHYKPVLVQGFGPYNTQGYGHTVEPLERRTTSLMPVQGYRHHFTGEPLEKFVINIEWLPVPWPPFVAPTPVPDYEPFNFPDDDSAALSALALWSTFEPRPDGCDGDLHYIGAVPSGVSGFNGIGRRPGEDLLARMAHTPDQAPDHPFGGRTMAHEMGHNYGRGHVDCGNPDPPLNVPPFDPCTIGPIDYNSPATFFGFDPLFKQIIPPDTVGDLMSYAGNRWMSKFTFDAIWPFIGAEGAVSAAGGAAPPVTGPQLLIAGEIEQETEEVSVLASVVLEPGEYPVDKAERSHAEAVALGPEGLYDWVLRDKTQGEIGRTKVAIRESNEGPGVPFGFAQYIDFPAATARLELVRGGHVLWHLARSGSAPVLTLSDPIVDTVAETLTLEWSASDPDGDFLTFSVHYTPDGASWHALRLAYPAFGIAVSTRLLPGGSAARLRVIASDGLRSASAQTPPFSLPDHAPVPEIMGLREGEVVPFGQEVELFGTATDAEDGEVSAGDLEWELDGIFAATGDRLHLPDLLPASYDVELQAMDSDGRQATEELTFEVAPVAVPETAAPSFDGRCNDAVYREGTRISIPLAEGAASARLVHADSQLYVCLIDLIFWPPGLVPLRTVVGLAVDTLGDGGSNTQTDDRGFFVDQDGTPFQRQGIGGSFEILEAPASGFEAYVARGGGSGPNATGNWRAELRIDDTLLGGWDHAARLAFVHSLGAALDGNNWPANSSLSIPDTWAPAYLGEAPPLPANRSPVAVVGPDQVLTPLVPTAVYLDGSQSFDPDGDSLSFEWQQVEGPDVLLHSPDSATPHFSALPVDAETELVFELVVDDGILSSPSAETSVKLFPVAQPALPTPDPAGSPPEFVIIGSPGNPGDGKNLMGAVAYVYEAASTEVPNVAYVDFLNHVAANDVYGLYDPLMESDPHGGIVRTGAPGAYVYETKPYMATKPVNFVSWVDAARYVNWLENGKPSGLQDPNTTEDGSYDLTLGSPGTDATRRPEARYVLATEDEWYKAAYHDPVEARYWAYPTGSNAAPEPALATARGSAANPGPAVANYAKKATWNGLRGNVIAVGSSAGASPHGTLDQGGNVAEWLETRERGLNRIIRGGSYLSGEEVLRSPERAPTDPALQSATVGFRVFRVAGSGGPDFDGDGVLDVDDNCPTVPNAGQLNSDRDTWGDACDNCRYLDNEVQTDHGHDGIGNRCDCDFTEGTGDGFVNVTDLLRFLEAFGQPVGDTACPDESGDPSGSCARYDVTVSDAFINVSDLLIVISSEMFGHPVSEHGCAEADDGLVHCPLP